MFEIDVYTRTTASQPFSIKTFKAETRDEVKSIIQEQSQILASKYKNPRQFSNGSLMQFKTNRGNLYAEIEVNRLSDT